MADLAPLALDFIRTLSKAIRSSRIYAPGHRETQKGIDDAGAALRKLLQAEPAVVLGTRDGALIVQNSPVLDASPAVKAFCEMLAARNIGAFRVEAGFSPEEFNHFIKLVAMNPDELISDREIRPELLEPLRHIRLNEVRFIAVDGDTPEGAVGSLPGLPATPSALNDLFASLLSGQTTEGRKDAGPGLGGLAGALGPLLNAPEKGKAVELTSRLFNQIVDQSLSEKPAAEFVDEYLKSMGSLPEEVRKAVMSSGTGDPRSQDARSLIERLPMGLRGRVVAEDLRRGETSIEKLRSSVSRLAPTAADFVRMFEIVSRMTIESSASPQEETQRGSELLQLVPLADEMKRKRRSIFLLSRETSERLALVQLLEEAGFRVSGCGEPDATLPALLRTDAYDVVILDISRFHLAELKTLLVPEPGVKPFPLVLLEDTLRVRNSEEMEAYPEGRIFYKPVEAPELLSTLNEMVPPSGDPPPPPPPEEVEQAREIKAHLQPRELPSIPGYTVAVLHRAGSAHGGNCHEIVALPRKRFGILVFDVPGFATVAPAALFIARTTFVRVALQCEWPVQALARLNEALARTLPRGAFVRAAYAILDPLPGLLSLACAGFPRPFRWTDGNPAVKVLQATGLPLGPARGAAFEATLRPAAVTLAPGDHLLFHSGGAAQVLGAGLVPFGERRVAQAGRLAGSGGAGAAIAEVAEALLAHAGAEAVPEDITLLELHRDPAPGP